AYAWILEHRNTGKYRGAGKSNLTQREACRIEQGDRANIIRNTGIPLRLRSYQDTCKYRDRINPKRK
ncbi:MAG: hypothetical protein RIQ79_2231, partial [Verrucomicrobiota bacterium]